MGIEETLEGIEKNIGQTEIPLLRIVTAINRMADALETLVKVMRTPTVTTTNPMPEVWDPGDCASFNKGVTDG